MTGSDDTGGDASITSGDQLPAYFVEFQRLVDKRFEGLSAKLKPAPSEPAATSAPAASTPDVGELVRSAMAYGELRSGLTESARAKLDSLQEQGLSYVQLTAVAEALRSVRAPANGSAPAERSAPTGLAATPAPSSAAPSIRTVSELRALKKENPRAYAAWIADSANDISKLANR